VPTTTISIASFQTLLASLADAIAAGNFAAANLLLGQADAVLAALNISMKVADRGQITEAVASLQQLRLNLDAIRLNSVQDPSSDMVETSASFQFSREYP
jgi:hypothetical protein